MNPPSVWTDQTLWRRTVQENSLSKRVRTKWAWNIISLHSSSAGHKPNHQQPSEKKRNKCRGQQHQLAKHKWSHDADAWGCSFLPGNTKPSSFSHSFSTWPLKCALQSTRQTSTSNRIKTGVLDIFCHRGGLEWTQHNKGSFLSFPGVFCFLVQHQHL